MQNEVPHIYCQENETGSDSSSLATGQFIEGNVTRKILAHHRILAEKPLVENPARIL